MAILNRFQTTAVQPENQQYIPQVHPPQMSINNFNNNAPTVGVYWVQGIEGAKGFFTNSTNTDVYLRDSENKDILYIKSTDNLGMPKNLEAYRLEKINTSELENHQSQNMSNYVTQDQFNTLMDKINDISNRLENRGNRKPQYNKKRQNRQQNYINEEDNDYDE